MSKRQGWRNEREAHGLCARGIRVRKPKMRAGGFGVRGERVVWDELPDLLYHSTSMENFQSVLDNGLFPSFEEGLLAIADNEKNSRFFGVRQAMMSGSTDFVVFMLDKEFLEETNHLLIYGSDLFGESTELVTVVPIPPEAIAGYKLIYRDDDGVIKEKIKILKEN